MYSVWPRKNPSHGRLYGDLAYLEVTLSDVNDTLRVTATHLGLYVNRTTHARPSISPAPQPYFSHTLLDFIFQRYYKLRVAWADAQETFTRRHRLTKLQKYIEDLLGSLFRADDKEDYRTTPASTPGFTVDSITPKSSRIVPVPRILTKQGMLRPSSDPS